MEKCLHHSLQGPLPGLCTVKSRGGEWAADVLACQDPRVMIHGPFPQKSRGPLMYCCQTGEARKEETSFKVHGDVRLLGCLHSNSFLSLRMPRQVLNILFGSCSSFL